MSDPFFIAAAVAFVMICLLGFSSSKSTWPRRLLILAACMSLPMGLFLFLQWIPGFQESVGAVDNAFVVQVLVGGIAFWTAPFAFIFWAYALGRMVGWAVSSRGRSPK